MIKPVGINNNGGFTVVNNTSKRHAFSDAKSDSPKDVSLFAEKQFLFSSFVQPQKQVSFKSSFLYPDNKDWVMHLDGIVERAGVMVNGSYEKFDDESIPYKFPSAREFIKDEKNIDKIVPFYSVGYGTKEENGVKKSIYEIRRNGFVYIHPDNQFTKIDGRSNIGKKMVEGDVETSKEIEQLVDYFHKNGNEEMRNYLLEKGTMGYEKTKYIQVHYLIENGRDEEAKERHPDLVDFINQQVAINRKYYSYDYDSSVPKSFRESLATGDYGEAYKHPLKLPPSLRNLDRYTFDKVVDYVKDPNSFVEYENFLKEQTKYIQEIPSLEKNIELSKQQANFVALTETGRKRDAKHPERLANRQLAGYRELMSEFFPVIQNAIGQQIKEDKIVTINHFAIEREKEPIKEELQRSLLYPLYMYERNSQTVIPNCVMLYGENPVVMQDLISWVGDVSTANYMEVSSQKDIGKMQENILDALDLAEEKYDETGKRSIIFVNGMERLLNKKYNSQANIACLKDIMCNASEDYHSTIMFFAKDPSKLDEGALASHRVELKIEVPIVYGYDYSFLGREEDMYDDDDYWSDPYPISGN